jgi:fructose-1,6-bisphosphatase
MHVRVHNAAGGDRDAQKKLDVVANEVLTSALMASNVVGVLASEVTRHVY